MLGQHSYTEAATKHLAYSDLLGVHQEKRAFRHANTVPAWALDDSKTRLVIYNYVRNYLNCFLARNRREMLRPGIPLAEMESLAKTRVREVISQRLAKPGIKDKDRLIFEEHLRTSENGIAAKAARVIALSYRCRHKAPDVAAELEISHTNVRTFLHRLNAIARTLFAPEDCTKPGHSRFGKPDPEAKRARQIERYKRYRKATSEYKPRADKPTDELVALAKQYNEGATLRALCKQSGRSYTGDLLARFKRFGLVAPDRKRANAVRLTPELQEMADKFNSGVSYAALAKEYGLGCFAVKRRRSMFGLRDLTRRPNRNIGWFKSKVKATPQLRQLAKLRKKGATYVELAKRAKLTPVLLRYRLLKLGLVSK